MANYPPTYYPQPGAYAQQSQYMPQQYMQPQQTPVLSGRAVTGREEAMAVPVDFVTGVTVCPDLGHGVIYAKVLDRNTGTAPLLEFRRADTQQESENRMDVMQRQLDRILAMLEEPASGKHVKKEAVNDD